MQTIIHVLGENQKNKKKDAEELNRIWPREQTQWDL